MKDNRLGAVALICGAVSGIITLTFHPGGGQHRVSPAQFEMLIAVVIGIHALAMCGLPLSFAGALALTRRIDSPFRLELLGLIIYGFGLVAMMGAAAMSGLVTPDVLRQLIAKTGPTEQWHTLISYTHSINQAFARIGAVAFSVAILLWSFVIIKRRDLPIGLGIYGGVSAVLIVVGIAIGRLDLELHGFRVITLVQAIWFLLAGVFLWRCPPTATPSSCPPSSNPLQST